MHLGFEFRNVIRRDCLISIICQDLRKLTINVNIICDCFTVTDLTDVPYLNLRLSFCACFFDCKNNPMWL